MAYSEKEKKTLFNKICREISKGKSLRNVLKAKDMPAYETFYKWIDGDESKSKQYTRATQNRADNIFEDILDIADKQASDVYLDKDGKEQINHNIIQRARLQVDARKWMLGKMRPKKYGDKLELNTNKPPVFKFIDARKKK